jgi:hypothetical protein
MRHTWFASAAIAVLTVAPLTATRADPNPHATSVSTAFVKRGDMLNWLADGEHGLWIQAGAVRWFYARFSSICPGVSSTNSIDFDTGASDEINRTSSVIVPGGARCKVQSFVPSGGPPENRNAHVVMQPQTQ